jgi:DNA replication protein DnaC
MLTSEQQDVFTQFLSMVDNFTLGLNNERNMVFLSAPGGTGKTLIINTLLYALCGDGKVALATSSR